MPEFMTRVWSCCCLGLLLLGTLVAAEPATEPAAVEAPKATADAQAKAREEALQKRREQQLKILEQYKAQQAKEKAEAEAAQSKYPYQSTKFIPVTNADGNGKLFSFCLGDDQKLYGLVVAANPSYGIIESAASKLSKKEKQSTPKNEVVVLKLDGTELQRWEIGFKPERITVAKNGTIYVGGNGKLATYSNNGKLLKEVSLPHITLEQSDEAQLKTAALEQRDEQLEMYKENIARYQEMLKAREEAESKTAGDAKDKKQKKGEAATEGEDAVIEYDDEGRLPIATLRNLVKNMEKQVTLMSEQSETELLDNFKRSISSKNSIHALSLTSDSLIYTTHQLRGYGFAVWKVNLDLEQPTKIMQGLGGCCGQCDVQCCDDKLYVADNTKHRVSVYDLNGKKLSQAGKKGRDGDGENFGGCCNPMNVAFSPSGQILTAESEGYVKCFSPDGEFQALLGRSLLEAGCKHVALSMTKDSRYVVFLDQPGSRIVRLEKLAEPKPLETKTTAAGAGPDKASE